MRNWQVASAVAAGIFFLLLLLLPVFLGRFFVTPDMANILAGAPNMPPGADHPLGTQSEGRDMLAVMMSATPFTLAIGLLGGGLAMAVGASLGLVAGYFGGLADAVTRVAVDVMLTIPPLAILILVAASFPSVSIGMMAVIIAATGWMAPCRVVRAQMLALKEREFVRVAQLSGAGSLRIIFLELVPNILPLLLAVFVNAVMTATVASVGLEVLGLGPRNSLTLGRTIYEALSYTAMWRGMWWWWLPPVLSLICLFVGLFCLAKALDSISNPRLRRGEA